MKKYLFYRDDVYEPRLDVSNSDVKIPLSNIEIETTDTQDPTKAVILSKERLVEYINSEITTSSHYIGDVYFVNLVEKNEVITNFNDGLAITLANGDTFGLNTGADIIAAPGDTIQLLPLGENFSVETALVNSERIMIFTTNNNTTNNNITFINSSIDRLNETKLDTLNRTVFLSLNGDNSFVIGYTPTDNLHATTKQYVDSNDLIITNNVSSNQNRITTIEGILTGSDGVEVAERLLTTNYETLTGGGMEPNPGGTNTTCVFNLPTVDDNGIQYNFNQYDRMQIWLYDGVATSNAKMIVGSSEFGNFHFRENNFNVKAKIDTSTTPNTLSVELSSGNDDVSSILRLAFVEQVASFAAGEFVKQSQLVLKQDVVDQSLNTTSKVLPVAINEVLSSTETNKNDINNLKGFNNVFSINYSGDEFTNIGTNQELMYNRINDYVNNGVLSIGSAVSVAFINPYNSSVERTAHAEIISINNDSYLIGLDVWVSKEEDYRKGTLLINSNDPSDAVGTYLESYGFNQLGDFKWSWNPNLTIGDTLHGWVKADGRPTSGMPQAAIDMFGLFMPNLLNGNGKFIRANDTAGVVQTDATATNSLRIVGSTSNVNGSGRLNYFAGSVGYGLSSTDTNSHMFRATTKTTGSYASIANISAAAGASIWGTSGGNWRPDGQTTSNERINYAYTTAAMRVVGMSISGDAETRPENISMIPYIWVGW